MAGQGSGWRNKLGLGEFGRGSGITLGWGVML